MANAVIAGTDHPRFVPPAQPKTPKSESTRRHLIDVATELFLRDGYHAVSMRDIAAIAGLSKGAVYGHFRSKGQLLVEVIRWTLADLDAITDYEAASADPERGVDLMFNDEGRRIRLLEVDAAAAARHDDDVASGLAHLYNERHARIRDAMVDSDDPDTVAWLIAALTAGIGMKEATAPPLPDRALLRRKILAAIEAMT